VTRQARAGDGGAAPEAGGTPVQLTLLGRSYCHLCDDMAAALAPLAAAHGARVAVVDVDADPVLEAAYGERVPVLFLGPPGDGAELCHFRLDAARVGAALAAGASEPARRPETC
jgi:thiol-disulfide isomerase/thioredoxin